MFEKFGEMGSAEEINLLAGNLLKEGDKESLFALAKENGISDYDVEDLIDGETTELCTVLTAAIGKLELEEEALDLKELMKDWSEWIKAECVKDTEFAKAVRRNGKRLSGALGAVLKKSWEIKFDIPSEIVRAAGIGSAKVQFGVPGTGTLRKIVKEYYGR
jgi:hypothetical protein